MGNFYPERSSSQRREEECSIERKEEDKEGAQGLYVSTSQSRSADLGSVLPFGS
jgi:hypothetical protein